MSMQQSVQTHALTQHETAIGLVRIAFGVIWAIDAAFKWQPAFLGHFVSFLTGAQDGQPAIVAAWLQGWIDVVSISPTFFAVLVALAETFLALSMIFGAFTNLGYAVGIALTLAIWTTAEGFGGPYVSGSTDIGTAIIYALVFAALYLLRSGNYLGMDRQLSARLGDKGWLASATPWSGQD